jgi:hypothetical protein
VRSVSALVLAGIVGVGLGLASARVALDAGVSFSTFRSGAWVGSPRNGGIDADPYTRAEQVRNNALPVGGGEGVTFVATHDDTGDALSGACDRTLSLPPPPARFWTLTLVDSYGRRVENPMEREGFTSQEVVRGPGGVTVIALSTLAQAGNWLPVPQGQRYQLVLRYYDTPLSTTTTLVRPILPQLERGVCR